MIRWIRSCAAASAALAALAFASTAAGEEGLWTFDRFPAERMQRAMGWAPDEAWLDRVMRATARLPGCSGANVSAQGLVLTNQHCVIDCITALSTAEADYFETGYAAATRERELRCPNMNVQLLLGIEDVTERIDAAAGDVASPDFARIRDEEIARIQRECTGRGVHCEVVTLYEGGRYALYRYRRYDDVRLVFAPDYATAAFGGEGDNFEFPRYCADFAFLRVYENGAPARTPRHLHMRFTPPEEGEVVVMAGNPGPTMRFRTVADLEFERDVNLPAQIALATAARDRLAAYAARGVAEDRAAAAQLQGLENTLKGLEGRLLALSGSEGMARVAEREADLQTRVRRNRAAARETGDAWGEIARARAVHRRVFARHALLEQHAGERSLLFYWARDIVRGASERRLADEARMPRYAEARLPVIANVLRAERRVSPDLEALHLESWLSTARQQLAGERALVSELFGDADAATLAARLSQSRLADAAYRMELWNGGAEAVAASDDPMIVFMRALDAPARSARAQYSAEVAVPIARAHERIARARFRAFGEAHYPNATLSPRLSYGRIEGWTEADGRAVPAFTNFAGMFARADAGEPLGPRWAAARANLDSQTIFNIAASTDVIAGNSGSPLLDREGRVLGAVFDGNIHSLAGDYYYDGALNRSVTVASTAIRGALIDVYGMRALVVELER